MAEISRDADHSGWFVGLSIGEESLSSADARYVVPVYVVVNTDSSVAQIDHPVRALAGERVCPICAAATPAMDTTWITRIVLWCDYRIAGFRASIVATVDVNEERAQLRDRR
ncbi:hypothetical protein BZM27_23830 [Paraburkholderia steynii]|uniref:Uncharacterized protein n=1 Tax=Paraburkholderia steynii TaxID=1245441 RepID=A0A4R0XDI2_9BURK|nr:hypothetical protein BZM27_23830 [Paraburkholderia steynii]